MKIRVVLYAILFMARCAPATHSLEGCCSKANSTLLFKHLKIGTRSGGASGPGWSRATLLFECRVHSKPLYRRMPFKPQRQSLTEASSFKGTAILNTSFIILNESHLIPYHSCPRTEPHTTNQNRTRAPYGVCGQSPNLDDGSLPNPSRMARHIPMR